MPTASRFPCARRLPLLLAALAALMSPVGCGGGGQRIEERVTLVIGGEEFRVEVARTDEQQRVGLMHRRRLGQREGMLFVYPADQHLSFWMKNTLIPLSLLFLSRDGEILQVESLEPGSLKPVESKRAARYALELGQGVLEPLGVGPGDRVRFPEGFR